MHLFNGAYTYCASVGDAYSSAHELIIPAADDNMLRRQNGMHSLRLECSPISMKTEIHSSDKVRLDLIELIVRTITIFTRGMHWI